MDLQNYIRDIQNFPKEGITFKDITPLLQSPEAFTYTIESMAKNLTDADVIVWLDARGFIFASAIAYALEKPLVIVRKTGKLPHTAHTEKYDLEYGSASFDLHIDSIEEGQKVAIIDDVLATGGTAKAAWNLVKKSGWILHSYNFLMELSFLDGRKNLTSKINSLITY